MKLIDGRLLRCGVGVIVCAAVLIASSGAIIVLSTNQVNNSAASVYRWEPTSGVGSTWAHGWNEIGNTAFVSSWNGSAWRPQISLTAPNGHAVGDLNLSYDSTRSRFAFAALEL